MDLEKSGNLLRDLRKTKDFTQKQLAEQLHISPKTVSKWETGKGFPDVSLLAELAEVLGVSEKILLSGAMVQNRADTGNLKRTKFYVCPYCGSFMQGIGQNEVICCGKAVEALVPAKADEAHALRVSTIENDFYIEFDHEMTKSHYIQFIAYVGVDRVLTVRLYPEQASAVRVSRMFGGKIYSYCNNHGLFEHK